MRKKIQKKARSSSQAKKTVIFLSVCAFFIVSLGCYLLFRPSIKPTMHLVEGASSPDEIIVKFKPSVTSQKADTVHKSHKTSLKKRITKLGVEVVKISDSTVSKVVEDYRRDPAVLYVEPNFKAEATEITNDPSLSQEYGLYKIQAANAASQSAWSLTHGNTQTILAILDTGIETTHPDLQGKVVLSQNFSTSSSSADLYGHGTHVAGITAALTNNEVGVAGVGYNTALMNVKVLGDDGFGYYDGVANGIIWATDNGAKVINMSLGGPTYSQVLEEAVNYAWTRGVVVVAAAGNNNSMTPFYPAYYKNVIAVAATDSNDGKATFSNYGNGWVDIAAPGVNVYSTYKNASYALLSGTSMATPYVAGTAALVWARGLCQYSDCVRNQLESTSDHISGTGIYWAWGRLNAYKAVNSLSSSPLPSQAPVPTNTPTPLPTSTPTPIPTRTPTPTPTKIPTPTPTTIGIPTPTRTIPTPTPANKQNTITINRLTASYRKTGINRWISGTAHVVKFSTSQDMFFVRVTFNIIAPSGQTVSTSGFTGWDGNVTGKIKSKEKGLFTVKTVYVSRFGYTYIPTVTTTTISVE